MFCSFSGSIYDHATALQIEIVEYRLTHVGIGKVEDMLACHNTIGQFVRKAEYRGV